MKPPGSNPPTPNPGFKPPGCIRGDRRLSHGQSHRAPPAGLSPFVNGSTVFATHIDGQARRLTCFSHHSGKRFRRSSVHYNGPRHEMPQHETPQHETYRRKSENPALCLYQSDTSWPPSAKLVLVTHLARPRQKQPSMDDQLQREVARGLREGKTEAWRALYDAYCRQVWCSVARAMGPDSADVADVVQETFLAAARSAQRFDPARGSLWMWLSGIARKHVALHYRQQKRHDRAKDHRGLMAGGARQVLRWLDGAQSAPAEVLATAELSATVRATLSELPTDYETLLTAKYFDGASVEEIAGAEASSSTAIRSKLARARLAFRQAFARTSAGCGDGHGGQNE